MCDYTDISTLHNWCRHQRQNQHNNTLEYYFKYKILEELIDKMPPKREAKKQMEQCRESIIQSRNQKKVAEANARAAEEQMRANTNAVKARELETQLAALKAEMTILTEGYEEMEKELADRMTDYNETYGEEIVMMNMDTLEQLVEMLNKQPKRDDMLDKFSEIYSHQRKTDIPLYDGIVSKEKLIEDWLREAS